MNPYEREILGIGLWHLTAGPFVGRRSVWSDAPARKGSACEGSRPKRNKARTKMANESRKQNRGK